MGREWARAITHTLMTGTWQPPGDTQMQRDINGEVSPRPCAQGGGCSPAPCLELGYEIKRQLRLMRSLEFCSTLLIGKVYFHKGGGNCAYVGCSSCRHRRGGLRYCEHSLCGLSGQLLSAQVACFLTFYYLNNKKRLQAIIIYYANSLAFFPRFLQDH